MALDTTVGGADANSYATVEDLDAYADARMFVPEWFADADDALKERALKMAARLLDALFVWTGSPVDGTQALTWPRDGMFNRNGFAIATTALPRELKEAQCEFALSLGAGDRTAENDPLKQGITSIRAGSVGLTFKEIDEGSTESADIAIRKLEHDLQWASNTVPDSVRQLIPPSWYVAGTIQRPLIFSVS